MADVFGHNGSPFPLLGHAWSEKRNMLLSKMPDTPPLLPQTTPDNTRDVFFHLESSTRGKNGIKIIDNKND